MNVLFIGAGNIAQIVRRELASEIERCWYFDIEPRSFDGERIEGEFFVPSEANVVIEAASVEAVKSYGLDVLRAGVDFYVMSSGAFADPEFFRRFMDELRTSRSRVFVPSGAIGGLDIIYAVRDYVESVKLTTRKPPRAFGLEGAGLEAPKIIFRGSACEAIERFPQNANVAVTLSLAVSSFDKVTIEILADPTVDRNVHEISVTSSVGDYRIELRNRPSPNPKTSYLAPLSLVAALKKRAERFVLV